MNSASHKSQDGESRTRKKKRRFLLLINLLLGLALVAGAMLLFPPVAPAPRFDFQLNQVTNSAQEVIAPIDFRVPVDERLLEERRVQASLQVPPVYREDGELGMQIRDRLDRLRADLEFVDASDSTSISSADSLGRATERRLRLQRLQPNLDYTVLAVLLDSPDRALILERVQAVCDSLLDRGILDTRSPFVAGHSGEQPFILLGLEGERSSGASGMLDQDQLEPFLDRRGRGWSDWRAESAVTFRSLSRGLLRPNLSYLDAETTLRKQQAAETVASHTLIPKGVRILGPNTQVTQEHLDKLSALESEQGLQPESRIRILGIYLGRILLLLFILFLAMRFLTLYRSDFFLQWRHTFFLVALQLLFLSASSMLLDLDTPGLSYLLPIAFVAMLVAGLYDLVLAVVATLGAILLLGISTEVPPDVLLVAFLAGGAAIFSVGQIRSRLQLYKSISFISLAYMVGIGAVELGLVPPLEILKHAAIGMGGGLICAWLVLPITPLLERFLDITTELSLLELTDLNRPILKRMKVEAPGSFQHSLVVSNLAEAAADAIGARPLLAKVCAYYHDIGKLVKPDYFGENVRASKNRHDKLTPNMSALIISAHVKEGLELAEKIKLPSIVSAGIPEHHGTTVMEYFYRKAQDADPKGTVRAEDFRYPGPRPQSPETAILMMADTVEATVRSLDAPTPNKIRSVVTDAIEKRMKDGQLEECGLSLQDLASIRESFITTFHSIYHPRIKYPRDSPSSKRPAIETDDSSNAKIS
ncbi:HDIG domain-containing protein [bacterium]|nr:HDIG domain-containing protein [bacterium]